MHLRATALPIPCSLPALLCAVLLTGLLFVAAAVSPPALAAAPDPGVTEVVTLRAQDGAVAETRIRVLESTADGLTLELLLPELQTEALQVEGETFHLLAIPGGAVAGAVGEPMLPTFSRLIQIPAAAGVSFEVTGLETTELEGYRPVPMQSEEAEQFTIDRTVYAQRGFLGGERVRIGEPGIARDLRVVPIVFSPLRYDPSRDLVEVASRITVAVRFAGVDLRNTLTRSHPTMPAAFDRLYRSLVVNYQGPREDQTLSLGMNVIICPDNALVVDALQPLIEWRTRKGFQVYLATTAETGTNSSQIQNWLQEAYQTWENPPDYITLVGDTGGSVAIPSWGNSDHEYTQLDGGDILSDANIGRISVDSVSRLQLYVNKIVGYESTPYMDETDWFTHACLTGDPGSSGITCVQIMQWLKIRLLEWGYTEVDTIFSYPFVSQMQESLNQGTTVFAYRGYIGMSGFDTGHISALQNGWKMTYAVNITCATGNFDGSTSRSEAWIRAGSPPDQPTGGIASVGTATSGTHTRYNNCMMYGIWRGVFWEDLFTFGESLTRGKWELYVNYIQADPGAVSTWSRYNNLMGDPAGEIWTAVPEMMMVTHPLSLELGANSVTVAATAHGDPVDGAYVCLWKGDELHIGGYTGADGTIELPTAGVSAGQLKITVTKHDHHPYLGVIPIAQADRYVGYLNHEIDDDLLGESSGNGDGVANPKEELEIPVQVRNFGTEPAEDVTGTLTCDDPYVTLLDDTEAFGDIAAGAAAWGDDDFGIAVAGGTPNGHLIRLGLDLESGSDSWHSMIEIPVVSAEFVYDDLTLYDLGAELDPGEEGEISISILNAGGTDATTVTGTLASGSGWITVTDNYGTFGDIDAGDTGENTSNRFAVRVDEECFRGHVASMVLYLDFSDGVSDTAQLVLAVGSADSDDPTGPDAYGYYAFDDTDTAYEQAPTYEWIEIATNHGGPGEDVGLYDTGGNNDDSRTVDLPFPFTFYGETFTRTTICSNGWMSMGSTYLENRRNWNIPAAGAPPYLIAPMWDNLYQSGQDKVYHWFDEENHRYVVQWSRMRNNAGGAIENFQAILYDPAHYPTPTGDGMIVFQYHTFSNSDYLQHYCTVGIENADQTDGVMYSYFNRYNAGAETISAGRAIRFTPILIPPRGTLSGLVTNESNGGTPIAEATVEVLELEQIFTTGPDGSYSGLIPVGVYTLVAAHPSFASDTASGVWIIQGETTQMDFALIDILPPAFSQTTVLENTSDATGPYDVLTTVKDWSDLAAVSLFYIVNGTVWNELPMESAGGDRYRAQIPGQQHGSRINYYLVGEDAGGLLGWDPRGAPETTYEFWVLEPLLIDDMEGGSGDWTHYVVTGGFADQWHRSNRQNHTPFGLWSWKFGDPDDGDYADYGDGALESAPVTFDGDATLTFWHFIDAEIAESDPGYAYDGGLVEMSVDGGPWTQIDPVGGYPYLILESPFPGPFPADTPVFSGTQGWTRVQCPVEGLTSAARFRFRFGSDGSAGQTGWFIDDVEILPDGPGLSGRDEPLPRPKRLTLHPCAPNPFASGSGTARIRFDLPQEMPIRLDVLDVSGRVVRRLASGTHPAGFHEIGWDGRAEHGRTVAAGVYFYVLQTPGKQMMHRVLLVR